MSELLTTVKQMKDQTTQMSEIITLFCEKRSENEHEGVHDKIAKIIESTEEKNEIKKITEVESRICKISKRDTNKSSRNRAR